MDSTPIYQYAKPTSARLEPPKSLDPIITPGYELRLYLIKLIRDKSFSEEGNENPYSHLREFEQTCACLRIVGMSDKTLRWKLFPFSLMGRAKHWETICSKFCLRFFSISKVVNLRKEVLNFRQLEEESLATSWDHLMTSSSLALTLPFKTRCFFNIFT